MTYRLTFSASLRRAATLAAAVVAFACGGSHSPSKAAAPTTGGIVGTVIDPQSGQPVAGAQVSTEPPTVTATTNADGTFSMDGIPAGTYVVIFVVDGSTYASCPDVVVVAGQQTQVNPDYADRNYATTCLGCHLNRDALVASLQSDPLPQPVEASSAGEG